MKEARILSARSLPPDTGDAPARPAPAQPFDACHTGVVLRAVLLVETIAGAGALFVAAGPLDWLWRLAGLTAGVLPATLGWLLLACSLQRRLVRWPRPAQYAAGAALGALAGLGACALLALLPERAATAPWVASAVAGALVAMLLMAGLVLRARGRAPAAVAAQLAELQARIRPHFLFNTLNSAVALVRAEPSRAEALLEDLSDLFRHALVERGESSTLAEEIVLAQRYLAIEQVRFGSRLQVDWALDPAAGTARVPPLLLQPLVENAVIHGVEASARGARLRISTERRGGSVILKITNDVPPQAEGAPAPRAGHGMAQDNVRARLALLHDVEGSFRAERRGNLYRVRIRLPA